jgi:hypothetical protein
MLRQHLSAKGFSQPAEIIFENMQLLENKLQKWRADLPHHLLTQGTNPLEDSRRSCRHRLNSIQLQNVYYGSILALHANIQYPWVCSVLLRRRTFIFRDQISHSSVQAAEASRQILASLKDFVPDLASSSTYVLRIGKWKEKC